MREKDFQREISRSVPPGTYFFKIPDAPRGPETRFSTRKGVDCFLLHRGRFLALELKQSKHVSVAFGALNDFQEETLLDIERAGGNAYVVVNFRVQFSAREAIKRNETKTIRAYAMPIDTWVGLRSEATRASLTLDDMDKHGIRLAKIKTEGGIGWDLSGLLDAWPDVTLGDEMVNLANDSGPGEPLSRYMVVEKDDELDWEEAPF